MGDRDDASETRTEDPERSADGQSERTASGSGTPDQSASGEDAAERRPIDQRDGRPTPGTEETDDEEAPLERLAGDVRQRRQDEPDSESDPFERMEAGAVDGEDVWEEILSEGEASEAERAVGVGASAIEVDGASEAERTEYVVPKDEFCGRCPYLGDPPELACENDSTEIVEVTDSERFRVRGCPFAGRDDSELADFE